MYKDWLRLYRDAFTKACDALKRPRIKCLEVFSCSSWTPCLPKPSFALCSCRRVPLNLDGPFSGRFQISGNECGVSMIMKIGPVLSTWSNPWFCQSLIASFAGQSHSERATCQSASGVDGWSCDELRMLPSCTLQPFADLWTSLESSGCWEHVLLVRSVAIPKPGAPGKSAADFRHINILPRLFRLALGARALQILRPLVPHVPSWLIGSVPGRSVAFGC